MAPVGIAVAGGASLRARQQDGAQRALAESSAYGQGSTSSCGRRRVSLRRGPTGWYVQRGERAGKEKPDRMSLPPSLEPDDLDLGLALRLLALPRRVGLYPETGEPILAGIGRYGPWVRHGETYAAIPEGEDVLTVGINRAVALIADKEIRQSRARGPNTVLRELGAIPATAPRCGSRPATTAPSSLTGGATPRCRRTSPRRT